ncbi:MAG: aminopeptidase P family protein [Candidatus Kapabacteria bacterium]|nr:aminopeptidase P family protein [Candidatus Kapabacteria bacterium]
MAKTSQRAVAEARLDAVRQQLRANKLDAYVIAHLPSIRYITGFSGSSALVVVTKRKLYFVTNDLYDVQVRKELVQHAGLEVIIDRDPWKALSGKGLLAPLKTIGFDPSRHSHAGFLAMKKASKGSSLVPLAGLIDTLLLPKSASEIKSIAAAAEITSRAFEKMLGMVRAGMTERDVATFLATTTRQMGSEKDAFDIIVVAGARSAMPHGRASMATIKKGDVITVDFGCCVDGLYSDMTRTFCVGSPSQKIVDVFAVLYQAHMSALDAAVTGVTGAGLDAAAREVIARAGYGDNFRHSLGHGLGYEVHEHPRVAPGNSGQTLPTNCVVTIEPGIYLPGKFGMRIEDDVVITPSGPKILTSAPRELVVV